METIKKKVVPCGFLFDPYGNLYFLLSPRPIPWDSWATDKRQAWQCVRAVEVWDKKLKRHKLVPYGGQVSVVCSIESTIEIGVVEPIEINTYFWERAELLATD